MQQAKVSEELAPSGGCCQPKKCRLLRRVSHPRRDAARTEFFRHHTPDMVRLPFCEGKEQGHARQHIEHVAG